MNWMRFDKHSPAPWHVIETMVLAEGNQVTQHRMACWQRNVQYGTNKLVDAEGRHIRRLPTHWRYAVPITYQHHKPWPALRSAVGPATGLLHLAA